MSGTPAEQVAALKEFISAPEAIVLCLVATIAANVAILLPSISALEPWVARQPWWPQARKLQKHMNMNFGYAEEDCTDEVLLNFYCFVCCVSVHHIVLGLASQSSSHEGRLATPCSLSDASGRLASMDMISSRCSSE